MSVYSSVQSGNVTLYFRTISLYLSVQLIVWSWDKFRLFSYGKINNSVHLKRTIHVQNMLPLYLCHLLYLVWSCYHVLFNMKTIRLSLGDRHHVSTFRSAFYREIFLGDRINSATFITLLTEKYNFEVMSVYGKYDSFTFLLFSLLYLSVLLTNFTHISSFGL